MDQSQQPAAPKKKNLNTEIGLYFLMKGKFLPVFIVFIIVILFTSSSFAIFSPELGVWGSAANSAYHNGTLNLKGLYDPVSVKIDASGVAHIYAQNNHDLFMAQGYYEASNRLFEMEFQAMLASGNLSQWVGSKAAGSDMTERLLQVPYGAVLTMHAMEINYPIYYSYLEDFSQGVNDYISTGHVPIEFKLLKVKPFMWAPIDSLYWASYFGKGGDTGLGTILQNSILYAKLGYDNLSAIEPYYPYYTENITVIPGSGTVNGYNLTDQGISPSYLWNLNWFSQWATGINVSLLKSLVPLLNAAEKNVSDPYVTYNFMAPGSGSNVWAVAGNHSSTGHPILANDPHLSLLAPSIWIPMQLSDPSFNVTGWSLVDIPGILIGHTNSTAWGGTNAGGSTVNVYLEVLNGSNYYFNDKWYPLASRNESVNGKPYTIYYTNNGPLIARNFNYGISLSSDNLQPNYAIVSELELDQASNYSQMLNAFKVWHTGPRNWAFATADHIGVIAAAGYPTINETLPNGKHVNVIIATSILNGSGNYEPSGFVPFKYLPQIEDPVQGYIYAPNQPTVGMNYPFPEIGNTHSSGGRAETIAHYLASHHIMNISNMMSLQSNESDFWASELTPYILEALNGMIMNSTETAAYNYLSTWNYTTYQNQVGITVYYYLLDELYNFSIDHILAQQGLKASVPSSTVLYLAQNDPNSPWLNGNFTALVRESFSAASGFLENKLGNPSNWEWGKVHELLLENTLGINALSVGPIALWGDNHAVSAGYTTHTLVVPEPYVSVGPSLRFIASPYTNQYWGVFPGGPSANVLSNYFENQLPYWLNHEYYNMNSQLIVVTITYE